MQELGVGEEVLLVDGLFELVEEGRAGLHVVVGGGLE